MALIKNLTKKEQSARLGVSLPESVLRRLDAYRLFLEAETGYLPERAETVEQFFLFVFGEDRAFGKWYQPGSAEQAAKIDALQRKEPAVKAGEGGSPGQQY